MTVKELIQELEKVHDKDLDVIVFEGADYSTTSEYEIRELKDYYYGRQEKDGYVHACRKCILIG